MSRIRSIKPDAFESLTLARVPVQARWLFAGLWTAADDKGRLPYSVPLIRSKVFPVEDMPLAQVEDWLDDLYSQDHICRYKVDTTEYLHIPKWRDHQVISHPTPSRLPPCPEHDTDRQPPASTPGRIPHETVSGVEPPRRCLKHLNMTTAPNCGACKDARLAHEWWERARREQQSREKNMAANTPCGSAQCECDHAKCDVGWVTVKQRLHNGRVEDAQAKCPECWPGAPTIPWEPVVDAREIGAEYADHAKAAAGDHD